MKNIIYYFSSTGNSLFIAQRIKESLNNTKIIRITVDVRDSFKNIEAVRIGFIFPVYVWRLPHLVEQFIKRVKIRKAEYVFTLGTHGGNPGDTFNFLEALIQRVHKIKCSTFEIKMPCNYIIKHTKPKKSIDEILREGNEKINLIIKEIIDCKKKSVVLFNSASNRLRTWIIHPLYSGVAKFRDRNFIISGKCISCGICEKICPASNIVLHDRPFWKHKCEFCLACINWCSRHVISFKAKNREINYYYNKNISINDLIEDKEI